MDNDLGKRDFEVKIIEKMSSLLQFLCQKQPKYPVHEVSSFNDIEMMKNW